MSVKKINPNGLCVKTLKICYLSTGGGFLTVVSEMAERGYSIEWKVYNSKDYGVPQNRERVYIVGYIGERCTRCLLPIARENSLSIQQIGNLTNTNSFGGNPQSGRVYSTNGIAPTINTCGGGNLEPKIMIGRRVRKITPREFWRLQGFTDEQFEKAAAVNSNSQLYKQAGNAVTVNGVEEIGKHIMSVENGV